MKRNPILEELRKTISEETKQSVEIEMLKQDAEYWEQRCLAAEEYMKCNFNNHDEQTYFYYKWKDSVKGRR